MTDTTTDTDAGTTDTTTSTDADTTTDTTTTDTVDWKAEAEKHKALARKHEDRAKANAAAAKELETVKAASMTEQDKAVAAAKAEGIAEAAGLYGSKVAAAEFKAAAAGRLNEEQLTTLLAGLDLKAFLDETGDVDTERIKTFVDGIAPAASEEQEAPVGDLLAGLDLGQGKRTSTAGLGTTQFQRDLEKSLGI